VIEVSNLVKRYDGREVLRGVSFTIRPGEPTAYLGPNGAGKSTTVKSVAGLVRPDAGEVRVCGHSVADSPVAAKRCLGYVPDHLALYNTLTPREYLSLVAELHHLERGHAAGRMEQMLAALEIAEVADRQIETLSRGQKQKVLILAALLHDPEVLLLDEPLNGLDVNASLTLRRVFEELIARGKTILFCSHIFEMVERICVRAVVIDRGQVVADDSMANLRRRTREGTLEAVFRQLTRPEQVDEGVRAFFEPRNRDSIRKQDY
jgi:ABC-2 type transport system ATP-binding protein